MGKSIQQSAMTQNMTIPEKRPRLVTVDIMQGLAMLLVVIGHHLLDFMPVGYGQFHHWLYIFHMPYFIFISGFLIAYSYKGEQYVKYIYRRFRKFFIPYVLIGVIVTLLASLKYGIASIGNNLLNLLISPKQSEATFLWYIYLLFFLYALYPAIHFIQKKNPVLCNAVLVIIGIILFMFPVRTQLLCLDYFTEYFIFYALGIVVSSFFKQIMSHPQANIAAGSVSLVCFIIISILTFRGGVQNWYSWLLCFLVIPAMYALSYTIKHIPPVRNTLVSISKNCFPIYLLHMFFVQGIAFIFTHISSNELDSVATVIYILISTVISIAGPIYIFKLFQNIKSS